MATMPIPFWLDREQEVSVMTLQIISGLLEIVGQGSSDCAQPSFAGFGPEGSSSHE